MFAMYNDTLARAIRACGGDFNLSHDVAGGLVRLADCWPMRRP
jgi:hypothetical protein